jgi:hypothetical protein
MFSSKSARVGAVLLLSAGLPLLATAPSGAAGGNRCVSVNGVTLVQIGTAECTSTPSEGSLPNIAIANGDHSFAAAHTGDNNQARANGPGSRATAARGGNNIATATGDHSSASAVFSENGVATATGKNSSATVSLSTNGAATATGAGSSADAGMGDHNTAIARGGCTATALDGDNLTATCP